MKNVAQISAVGFLLLLIVVVALRDFGRPSTSGSKVAVEEKSSPATNSRKPSPFTLPSLKKAAAADAKLKEKDFYVRSRSRQLLDDAGRVIFYAKPEDIPENEKDSEAVVALLKQTLNLTESCKKHRAVK